MYSNSMIKNLGNKFPLTPKEVTYFVGIFGLIGALMGPFIISRTPRKLNFLIWQLAMGISMTLIGVFKITK